MSGAYEVQRGVNGMRLNRSLISYFFPRTGEFNILYEFSLANKVEYPANIITKIKTPDKNTKQRIRLNDRRHDINIINWFYNSGK